MSSWKHSDIRARLSWQGWLSKTAEQNRHVTRTRQWQSQYNGTGQWQWHLNTYLYLSTGLPTQKRLNPLKLKLQKKQRIVHYSQLTIPIPSRLMIPTEAMRRFPRLQIYQSPRIVTYRINNPFQGVGSVERCWSWRGKKKRELKNRYTTRAIVLPKWNSELLFLTSKWQCKKLIWLYHFRDLGPKGTENLASFFFQPVVMCVSVHTGMYV